MRLTFRSVHLVTIYYSGATNNNADMNQLDQEGRIK